jgi:nicotinamidase/pyrazinamidase
VFDHILLILDTHFTEEYYQSDESKLFPIHCEYGSDDWELSIDTSGLTQVHYLLKNQFTMWGTKSESDPLFSDNQRKNVYDQLFHMIDDPHNPTEIIARDSFLQDLISDPSSVSLQVIMIGVASDYCIRYAMEGWLARGAEVTIISDLTKGITKETPEILHEPAYREYLPQKLRTISSEEFLSEIQ